MRRNITELNLCAYCGAVEDQSHLLLRCPRAKIIWRRLGWDAASETCATSQPWTTPTQRPDPRSSFQMPVTIAIADALSNNPAKQESGTLQLNHTQRPLAKS